MKPLARIAIVSSLAPATGNGSVATKNTKDAKKEGARR